MNAFMAIYFAMSANPLAATYSQNTLLMPIHTGYEAELSCADE
jgi:hypothetical protein